ncbi:hypothetical protein [Rhodoferax sp.]
MGLPCDNVSVGQFIESHSPLATEVKLRPCQLALPEIPAGPIRFKTPR